MFVPGETIVHEFIIPFKYYTIQKAIVTYKQCDRIILEKKVISFYPYFNDNQNPAGTNHNTLNDFPVNEEENTEENEFPCGGENIPDYDVDELFNIDPAHPILPIPPDQSMIVYELTQQETLLFDNDKKIKIQINIFFDNGTRVASEEMTCSTNNQYHRAVMTYDK